MSDAIARMAFYLVGAEPWKPDRDSAKGPPVRQVLVEPLRKRPQPVPALKRKVISALQRGPATGEQVAMLTRCNIHSIYAQLSRMYTDGIIKRSKSAVSAHTGRMVQVYELK
jgi:predicted Rossmann fold nucleotide-binding protein DprA/Smf involved in DNA uptake